MANILNRMNYYTTAAKYGITKGPRHLCLDLAIDKFKSEIQLIEEQFADIDSRLSDKKILAKQIKIVSTQTLKATAYFFRHLAGAVIHPSLSLQGRVKVKVNWRSQEKFSLKL